MARWTVPLALLLLSAAPLVPALRGPAPAVPAIAATHAAPLQRMAAQAPALPAIPAGLDAAGRAAFIEGQLNVQGRTPAAWLDLAHSYTLAVPAAAPPQADLGDAVDALYLAVGATPSPDDLAAAHAAAATVSPALGDAVANLIGVVAQATAAQWPVANDLAARLPGFRVDQPLMTAEERDATAARAASIVDAIANVDLALGQAQGPDSPRASLPTSPTCLAPVAPDCLAWLGSCSNDVYNPSTGSYPDPALIVDPCGDDTYHDAAGGANPTGLLIPGPGKPGGNGLPVAVVADLMGDDDYSYSGDPSVVQGSGSIGGLGLLVDAMGNDRYQADFVRGTVGPPIIGGVGVGYTDGGAQGTGYAGFGLLLDGLGDDLYDLHISSTHGRCIWGFAQGVGAAGGLGISSDLAGDDDWLSSGLGITGGNDCWGVGNSNDAFQGLYPQGVGIYGGVGIMTDSGMGSDDYLNYNNATVTDYYAQGFGAFAGLGVLYEDGGDDRYVASESASSTWINPTLNCAYGTGSLGGVGVMLELGGNDTYLVDTHSDKSAETMMEGDGEPVPGYGLFVDADGTDRHEGLATAGPGWTAQVFGRGVFDTGHNLAGTYLDLGSDDDTYIPAISGVGGTAGNNAAWAFGIDH